MDENHVQEQASKEVQGTSSNLGLYIITGMFAFSLIFIVVMSFFNKQ